MDQEQFVFRDPQGRRWRRVSRSALAAITLLVIALSLFIYSIILLPQLQPWSTVVVRKSGLPPPVILPQPPRPWFQKTEDGEQKAENEKQRIEDRERRTEGLIRLGFLDSDSDRALISLTRNVNRITHLAPLWLRVSGLPPHLKTLVTPEIQKAVAGKNLKLIPVLTNLVGERYDPETIEHLLRADLTTQRNFASELVSNLQKLKAHGVLIAWEQVDPTYHAELTTFIGEIKKIFTPVGLELWLSIPVGDDVKIFDLNDLATHVDRFVAALYYETGEEDPPGPIASLPWFRRWLDALVQYGAPSQWIIGLGTFGYDWSGTDSEAVAFYDIMARAAAAKVTNINNHAPYDGPSFTYREDTTLHTVWFLDAITFRDQQREILRRQLGGIAIDRLGSEDPAIWDVLDCGINCDPAQFQTIPTSNFIATVGTGDFLQVINYPPPQPSPTKVEGINGHRIIAVDADGNWGTTYQTLPQIPTVIRSGAGLEDQVAITFDDGPDPRWTPGILDILQQHQAKATFFVLGTHAIAYPSLVRRIVTEGHTLGNHTFNHPDLSIWDKWRVNLELNATQRAIESITGRSTLLFRPPYDADRTPHTLPELGALVIAQELGYIPTMASIDPLDWDRPSPEEMLNRIKAQRPRGNVILLHDGGNDRSHTLAALDPILDYLQARGDQIVPLHVLLNTTENALNPLIPVSDSTPQRVMAGTGLSLLQLLGEISWNFLIIATSLLLLRTVFVVIIAIIRARYEPSHSTSIDKGRAGVELLTVDNNFSPPISILLAAYNEEKVIAQTLEALLASNYSGAMEVIVVDDGSQDSTAKIVDKIAILDPRVRLLRQQNAGKATALRLALANAQHPFIAMLDADTQFLPNTLQELVTPLQESQVGAVSANIRVGNVNSWISSFQALEYLASFNLDRRAYGIMEAIPVVPGAASAYRAAAIVAAGGIQKDTLAEDTDLTLAMHKAGFKIRHNPRASAITEAPLSARALLRQRQRWSFGTLQCLWKHRDLMFSLRQPWLGWFVLPSTWFFHIFLVALAPIIDMILIFALLYGADSSLLFYILIFMGIDIVLALVACALEGEKLYQAWLVLPMRILYRPLLSLSVLYALQRAIRGTWVSWGIQERLGLQSRLNA